MTICERFVVAVEPFPFVDIEVAKPRPAVVLSGEQFNSANSQTIMLMVTTAARSAWPSDLPIIDLAAAGLRAASVVRFKLFTLPNQRIARTIGRLSRKDTERLTAAMRQILG